MMLISQPGFSCGLTDRTPSGSLTRTATVGEPAQPCDMRKAVRNQLSAGAWSGSAVTWPSAGLAPASSSAPARAAAIFRIGTSSTTRPRGTGRVSFLTVWISDAAGRRAHPVVDARRPLPPDRLADETAGRRGPGRGVRTRGARWRQGRPGEETKSADLVTGVIRRKIMLGRGVTLRLAGAIRALARAGRPDQVHLIGGGVEHRPRLVAEQCEQHEQARNTPAPPHAACRRAPPPRCQPHTTSHSATNRAAGHLAQAAEADRRPRLATAAPGSADLDGKAGDQQPVAVGGLAEQIVGARLGEAQGRAQLRAERRRALIRAGSMVAMAGSV